jgi:hypothetical protein
MSILSSIVIGVHGALYFGAGVCMLLPATSSAFLREWTSVYAMAFKPLRVVHATDDPEEGKADPSRLEELAQTDLGYRMLGYLLLLLGVCRVAAAVHWGCGYVYLGLATGVGEIFLVCNELLRFESMHLNRAVGVLLENMFVSILYISAAAPYCH